MAEATAYQAVLVRSESLSPEQIQEGTMSLYNSFPEKIVAKCLEDPMIYNDEHEHEFASSCCGAETSMMELLMCPACHEQTDFTCECGEVYEP